MPPSTLASHTQSTWHLAQGLTLRGSEPFGCLASLTSAREGAGTATHERTPRWPALLVPTRQDHHWIQGWFHLLLGGKKPGLMLLILLPWHSLNLFWGPSNNPALPIPFWAYLAPRDPYRWSQKLSVLCRGEKADWRMVWKVWHGVFWKNKKSLVNYIQSYDRRKDNRLLMVPGYLWELGWH